MGSDRKVYCKSCYKEVWISYEYNRCPFCGVPLDLDKGVFSYVIKRYSSFSFRYEYTLDGQQRYIFASSIDELEDKVLDRGFPWDDRKVPKTKEAEKIRKKYGDLSVDVSLFKRKKYKRYSNDNYVNDEPNDDYVNDEPFFDEFDVDDRGWH